MKLFTLTQIPVYLVICYSAGKLWRYAQQCNTPFSWQISFNQVFGAVSTVMAQRSDNLVYASAINITNASGYIVGLRSGVTANDISAHLIVICR